jgi:predicted small secreted protein
MKALLITAALLSFGALAACNTVRGAGQDVKATGQAVSNAATNVENDIKKDDKEKK